MRQNWGIGCGQFRTTSYCSLLRISNEVSEGPQYDTSTYLPRLPIARLFHGGIGEPALCSVRYLTDPEEQKGT
jgi:hypothetical protein